MDLRFYIDRDTQQPHIYQHGVNESEVAEILTAPLEDRSGTEESRVAVGRTGAGRFLRVIYVPESEHDNLFVITAYPLGTKALKALRRRLRRRS